MGVEAGSGQEMEPIGRERQVFLADQFILCECFGNHNVEVRHA
jgi:hypothetical protein